MEESSQDGVRLPGLFGVEPGRVQNAQLFHFAPQAIDTISSNRCASVEIRAAD